MLERLDGKLSRAVLRGGSHGDVSLLPDNHVGSQMICFDNITVLATPGSSVAE